MIYLWGDFSFDDPPPLSVAVDNLLSLWIINSSFPSNLLIQVPAFTLKKKLKKWNSETEKTYKNKICFYKTSWFEDWEILYIFVMMEILSKEQNEVIGKEKQNK